MSRTFRLSLLSTLLWMHVLTLDSTSLPAQPEPDALMSERIDVVEIQLEVLVTDRKGRPLDDLAPSDFAVTIGGEEAQVLAADLVGRQGTESTAQIPHDRVATTVADVPPAGDLGARAAFDDSLTLVLFVDLENINPITGGRMLGQIFLFLDAQLRDGDRVMVVGHDHGVRMRLPLTDDLATVRQTLVDVVNEHSGRMVQDPEQQTLRTLRQLYDSGVPCSQLEPVARNYAADEYRRTLNTLGGLQSFVESLGGIPGRKAVLHVSDGLPLTAGLGAFEFLIDVCTPAGLARGVASNPDINARVGGGLQLSPLDAASYDLSDAWTRLAARANRNNVTFYPLQAIGLQDPTFAGADQMARSLSPAAGMATGWNKQDALVMLGSSTGGAAILNRNRIGTALRNMENDLRHYYRLSVRLGGEEVDAESGDVRKLQVRVDRPDAEVRHRKSLHLQSRSEKVADQVLATALHGTGENSMGLKADSVSSTKKSKDRRTVRLQLEIPIDSLTLLPDDSAEATGSSGLFTVFLAAADGHGGWTPVRRSTMRVESPRDESKRPKHYLFEVEMELREGRHVVGFGVLDEIGGGTSYLRTEVKG